MEQIGIVEPAAVVLLGRNTFFHFVKAAGNRLEGAAGVSGPFGDIVSRFLDGDERIIFKNPSGTCSLVFPMWHPERMGLANAKAYCKNTSGAENKTALEIVKMDWKIMGEKVQDYRNQRKHP